MYIYTYLTINRNVYVLRRSTWRLRSINSEGLREKQMDSQKYRRIIWRK